jgi:hypothetical protein
MAGKYSKYLLRDGGSAGADAGSLCLTCLALDLEMWMCTAIDI